MDIMKELASLYPKIEAKNGGLVTTLTEKDFIFIEVKDFQTPQKSKE